MTDKEVFEYLCNKYPSRKIISMAKSSDGKEYTFLTVPKDEQPEILHGGKLKSYFCMECGDLFNTETGEIRGLSSLPFEDEFGEEQGFHTIYDELEGIKLF